MKTFFLILALGVSVYSSQTFAQDVKEFEPVIIEEIDGCLILAVPIIGKAGATINSSGKVKLCPGWAWNICAVIVVTIFKEEFFPNDIKEMEVTIYDEFGKPVSTEFRKGRILTPEKLDSKYPLQYLTGEDIELK